MKRIVFFGDSLTAGYGLHKPDEQSYLALIQRELDAQGLGYLAMNAGVSGDTSASGLSRLSSTNIGLQFLGLIYFENE